MRLKGLVEFEMLFATGNEHRFGTVPAKHPGRHPNRVHKQMLDCVFAQ